MSAVGEHLVDLRDIEYLYAATADDAYNALVCTRFAGELGRERVHQPPPAGEREHLQASREWRGKYAPHASLTHARLSELIADGYGFVVHEGGAEPDANLPGERWPVLAISAAGAISFRSAEDDASAPQATSDRVLWLERVAAQAVAQRRWRVSRRVAEPNLS